MDAPAGKRLEFVCRREGEGHAGVCGGGWGRRAAVEARWCFASRLLSMFHGSWTDGDSGSARALLAVPPGEERGKGKGTCLRGGLLVLSFILGSSRFPRHLMGLRSNSHISNPCFVTPPPLLPHARPSARLLACR